MIVALPRIFVSIASYRDPECQYTVKDAFEKATHPERIFFGICSQYDPEHDEDCFSVPPPYPDQVRELRCIASETKGACWARVKAFSLMRDEEYALQLDSHMRFIPGWDEALLDQLKRCPTRKAVISGTALHYAPPNDLQDCGDQLPCTFVGGIDLVQPLHLSARFIPAAAIQDKGPFLSAFTVFNFVFAPSEVFRTIPIDPHIFFRGIEITYSARLWTHGYDIYQPDEIILYHYWLRKGRSDGSRNDDYKSPDNPAALAPRQRLFHVLGVKLADNPDALVGIEKYTVGNERPLEDFWQFADIDLIKCTVGEKARLGFWTPYNPTKAETP